MQTDPFDLLPSPVSDSRLEGLEEAVWRRVAARDEKLRNLNRFASVQVCILAITFLAITFLASAVGGGVAVTARMSSGEALGVFSPHASLAPSSRLLGSSE